MSDLAAVLAPIAERIARAEEEVSRAEGELDVAIRAIESLPREEKRSVSHEVEDAFSKLRSVRSVLARLKELLQSGELPIKPQLD